MRMRIVRKRGVTWVGMVPAQARFSWRSNLALRLKLIASWIGEAAVLWYLITSDILLAQIASVLVIAFRHFVPPHLPPVQSQVRRGLKVIVVPLALGVLWLIIGVPIPLAAIVLSAVTLLCVVAIAGLMYLDALRFFDPVTYIRLEGDSAEFMNRITDEVQGRAAPPADGRAVGQLQ